MNHYIRHRSLHRVLQMAVVAAALLPLGCDSETHVQAFHVEIPDFDSGQIVGLGFWRLDSAAGEFALVDSVALDRAMTAQGVETVGYELYLPGLGGIPIAAIVERDPMDPDQVELVVHWPASPGVYRISTFNDAGDSPLSFDQKLVL